VSGWSQVIPDPDEPVVHVYAEGATEEEADRLEAELTALVEEILDAATPLTAEKPSSGG